ncbi:MAG: DUF962 domain-containing protein [Sneathiella sp.]|nr:DUF962 domain-containing protein [Sneathiella sp.]
MSNKISTYKEFWPFYLGEHKSLACRRLHFCGTTFAVITLVLFLVTKLPYFILLSVIGGYGGAWVGHFFFAKNKPATFHHPLWSLYSDFRMYVLWLSGNLGKEMKLYSVN